MVNNDSQSNFTGLDIRDKNQLKSEELEIKLLLKSRP